MNSSEWLSAHPGKTLNDYVQSMQSSSPAKKHERYLDALQPGRDKGYFRWLRQDDNGLVVGVWACLAAPALFGFALVAWHTWSGR